MKLSLGGRDSLHRLNVAPGDELANAVELGAKSEFLTEVVSSEIEEHLRGATRWPVGLAAHLDENVRVRSRGIEHLDRGVGEHRDQLVD